MDAQYNEEEHYLSVQEAAKYLGVSRDAIHHRIRSKRLGFVVDPFDNRRKLIRVKDLVGLKPPGKVLTAEQLKALEG